MVLIGVSSKAQDEHQITHEVDYDTPFHTSIGTVLRGNNKLFDGQEKENSSWHYNNM